MQNGIGKAIRILRQAKEWKLKELADRAQISVSFLSLVESGERQPSLDVIRRIAKALRIPSEALVLMALGSDEELKSSNERTQKLRSAIESLADQERKLRELLGE